MNIGTLIGVLAGTAVTVFMAWLYRRTHVQLREEQEERERILDKLRAKHTRRVKRLERERDRAQSSGHVEFVERLLPAVDSLRRAERELEDDPDDVEVLREGVEMAHREIRDALAAFDIEPIAPSEGEEFDPEHHEAIRAVDGADVDAGGVVECHRIGYRFERRVLRPASVAVSVADEAEADDAPTDRPPGEDEVDASSGSRGARTTEENEPKESSAAQSNSG